MNFTITSLIIALFLIAGSIQQECNRAGLNRFDELSSKATIFGNINLKFPEKREQVQVFCRTTNKHLNDAEQFNNKCSSKSFKQIYGIFVYSYRNSLKQLCKTNSKLINSFIDSTPCYNKNRQAEVNCYTSFVDHLLGAQNAVEKKRIPHICCSYLEYFECTKRTMPALNGCTAKKVDNVNNFFRSYADNVLNFLCGDHDGQNDKCVQLGAPPKKKKSQRRTKSISLPISDIILSLKET